MTSTGNSRNALLLALATILLGSIAVAAPRLLPPSQYMQQDRFRSVVAKVVDFTDEGRFAIEVIEQLNGETQDGLILRSGGGLGGEVEIGGIYIFGHTDKPARRSHRWDTDPEGPRVLNVPAVGAAVFENSAAMRTLVRAHPEDSPLTDRQRLDAVVEQLGSDHVQSRRFVLAELGIDTELRELVGERELEPMAHDYLLRAALPMVESWGGDWLAVDCRSLAAEHGTELDLASMIPSLMVTALKILGETGAPADADLTVRHLRSNNPGVGKAAFSALLKLDPERAAEAAEALVEDSAVHYDVRRFVAEATARREAETPSD